jgi:hypothetical protein
MENKNFLLSVSGTAGLHVCPLVGVCGKNPKTPPSGSAHLCDQGAYRCHNPLRNKAKTLSLKSTIWQRLTLHHNHQCKF